jgi:hypothetical protein
MSVEGGERLAPDPPEQRRAARETSEEEEGLRLGAIQVPVSVRTS